MKYLRLIFFLAWVSVCSGASAQSRSTVSATVDKHRILLGEPFTLTIEANIYPPQSGNMVLLDTIPHFEFSAKPLVDSTALENGMSLKAVYHLTSFDSGHWLIPSISLSKSIMTDTIPIDVVFSDFDSSMAYHDIKEVIEVKAKEKSEWWIYVAAGTLLVLGLIFYLLRRKKQPVQAKKVYRTDPYEEAMESLSELQRSQPGTKVFHSGLSDILRVYVYRRKGFLSMQKTTGDLVIRLMGAGLEKTQFDKLSQTLKLGDLVKFAKYPSTKVEDREAYETIRAAITGLEQIEKAKQVSTEKTS